jgi:branched-chain amino acid transport system permease protein
MDVSSLINYLVVFSIIAGIYAVLTIGLNIQWGITGLFNIGIAGFFAVGAYTSAILTTLQSPDHLGGYGLPFWAGILGAATTSGIIAFLIGIPTLRLKEDYLAIATIGIAETIRLIFTNESWLSNGTRGILGIPRPLQEVISHTYYNLFYFLMVIFFILLIYIFIEKTLHSPWGRILKAIREDEITAAATGKNVFHYKMQSFVIGAIVIGMAGALYAHFIAFISPEVFKPMYFTFIIWVMLIVGGAGNNRGAILGAFLIWGLWTGTEFLIDTLQLSSDLQTKAGALRIIIISIALELILLLRPGGILGEAKETFD